MSEPGTLIKEYKGFNIMLSDDGIFFCDTKDNSLYFEDHTLKSERIKSLEKAINHYASGGVKVGDVFYDIGYLEIKKLTVLNIDSNKIHFSDGTSTGGIMGRKELFPKSIEHEESFKIMIELYKEIKECEGVMSKLRQKMSKMNSEFSIAFKKLPGKVKLIQKNLNV